MSRTRVLVAVAAVAGSLLGGAAAGPAAYAVAPVLAPERPGDKGDKRDKPKSKPDRTPPDAPVLGTPDVDPGGAVTLPVRAERGSRVVVRERGGDVEATAIGTGATQSLSWTTSDGEHSYVVTATDRAGNRSRPASVSVDVDATPPPVTRLRARAGTAEDSRSRVTFRTEPGSAYRVLVDGAVLAEGVAEERDVSAFVDVADGRHEVDVEASDAVGNQASASESFRVSIGELAVRANVLSEPTARTQVIRVVATPNTTSGRVQVPGQGSRPLTFEDGGATLRWKLPDSDYVGVTVTVRDSQGRTGRKELAPLVVDTTAPEVEVAVDDAVAADGRLRATVRTEPGARVEWRLLDTAGTTVATGDAVADNGVATIERDVDEGSYRLEVTATDDFERASSTSTETRIADDPWPVVAVILGVAALVAAGVGLLVALVLLTRTALRRLAPARERRAEAREQRRAARAAAAVAKDAQAGHREAEQQWRRRRDVLAEFLEVAHGSTPATTAFLPGLALLPDEQVLHTTGGELYEAADGAGDELVLEGHDGVLAVTDRRIAFVGDVTRDWWVGLIDDMLHQDDDRTVLKRWHEDAWSGVTYDDLEATRLHLDLLLAEQRGTRDEYLRHIEDELRAVEDARPVAPGEQPEPAEV